MEELIRQLKEISETVDNHIKSAANGMRLGTLAQLQQARKSIQEAIAKLLEV